MPQDNGKLSTVAAVYHAADSLGLYRAELARILELMCAQVSSAAELELRLQQDATVRKRADNFLAFYQHLEQHFEHDEIAMLNWFRRTHPLLGTSPFLAIVDEGQLLAAIDIIS